MYERTTVRIVLPVQRTVPSCSVNVFCFPDPLPRVLDDGPAVHVIPCTLLLFRNKRSHQARQDCCNQKNRQKQYQRRQEHVDHSCRCRHDCGYNLLHRSAGRFLCSDPKRRDCYADRL